MDLKFGEFAALRWAAAGAGVATRKDDGAEKGGCADIDVPRARLRGGDRIGSIRIGRRSARGPHQVGLVGLPIPRVVAEYRNTCRTRDHF